jgi:hypothetical protein
MSLQVSVQASTVIYNNKKTLVERIELPDGIYARKTVKPLFGQHFAEGLCAREVRALEQLEGVPGIQQLVVQDSPTSFISTFIEGTTVRDAQTVPQGYFDRLATVLTTMHDYGVADLDFGHSCDLMIDPEGNPHVIDLAASLVLKYENSWMKQKTFDWIKALNWQYLARRKVKYAPAEATDAEKKLAAKFNTIASTWRAMKKIKHYVRRSQSNSVTSN